MPVRRAGILAPRSLDTGPEQLQNTTSAAGGALAIQGLKWVGGANTHLWVVQPGRETARDKNDPTATERGARRNTKACRAPMGNAGSLGPSITAS